MGKAASRCSAEETFRLEEVEGAVGDALRLGAIGFDAVKPGLCPSSGRPGSTSTSTSAARPGRDDVRQVVHEPAVGARRMTDTPQVLLAHHLRATLKLPTFLREYDKIARQCASEGVDHVRSPVETRRARADRPRAWSSGASRRRASPWSRASTARLQGHPLITPGPRAGPLRVRAPREPHRARQQWDRQDPHRPRSRPVKVGHHRRRASRTHRGPR